jgi:AcrR family transcriptional regulator
VADGALYNYFEDKEDLLARALLVHVGSVMSDAPRMPQPGTGTVAQNLELFVEGGLAVLERVAPAFAGLQLQPRVLVRFHAMVGGDAAFGVAGQEEGRAAEGGAAEGGAAEGGAAEGGAAEGGAAEGGAAEGGAAEGGVAGQGPRGLPDILRAYLSAEQRLGRIDASADIDAASTLIVGAIHGQILPRILLSPPGSPITTPPGFAAALANTVLYGIAPAAARS